MPAVTFSLARLLAASLVFGAALAWMAPAENRTRLSAVVAAAAIAGLVLLTQQRRDYLVLVRSCCAALTAMGLSLLLFAPMAHHTDYGHLYALAGGAAGGVVAVRVYLSL